MIQLDDKKQLFGAVIKKLEEAGASIGIDSLRTELASLKDLMEKPDFWNDVDEANRTAKKAKPIEAKISRTLSTAALSSSVSF